MKGNAMIVLVLAGLCGLGAMFGVRKLISQQTPATPEVELVDVLVAARDIKVEETLDPEMVTIQQMPRELVPVQSFTEYEQVAQRWAKMPLLEGDPITEGKLAPKGAPPGLISKITPGMRAVAIKVDEQTGISGFILPDYRVDVLQHRNPEGGRDDTLGSRSQQQTVTLLENIRVLASGNVMTSSEDRSIQSKTVTLELTPLQAEQIASAVNKGPLMLTLRSVNDNAPIARAQPEPEPEPVPEPEPEPEVLVAEAPPEPEPEPEPEPVLPPPAPEPALKPRALTVYYGPPGPQLIARMRPITYNQRNPAGVYAPEPASPPFSPPAPLPGIGLNPEPGFPLSDARRPFALDAPTGQEVGALPMFLP